MSWLIRSKLGCPIQCSTFLLRPENQFLKIFRETVHRNLGIFGLTNFWLFSFLIYQSLEITEFFCHADFT